MKYRRLFRFPFPDRERVDREVDEEFGFHLEMRTRELVERGMEPVEARKEALRRFGDLQAARRYCARQSWLRERGSRRLELIVELGRDVRHGMRALRRTPGFTLAALLTLGLGIGANTAIFSILDATLLSPLPYPEPDHLVRLEDTGPRFDGAYVNVNPLNLLDWRAMSRSFEELGGYYTGRVGITTEDGSRLVQAAYATLGFFATLRVETIRGRLFTAGEYERGGPPVVLLSREFWVGELGGDPDAVGGVLEVEDVAHTVIGVLAANARLPDRSLRHQPRLWLPGRIGPHNGRGGHWLRAIGRLGADVSLDQARTEMSGIARRLATAHPRTNRGTDVALQPLRESVVAAARPALQLLAGVVALVLLIACVNVTHLQLVRCAARGTEMSVRRALGASRFRIVRQLLTENLVLALAGGALGLILAFVGLQTLRTLSGTGIPRLEEATLDVRVLTFAFTVTVACGLLVGLVSALRASERRVGESLKEAGSRTAAPGVGAGRLGAGLVIAQVALAVALLTGAALLLHSFVRLTGVDPGFETRRVIALQIVLPEARYPQVEDRAAVLQELVERTRNLPGAVSAGAADSPPFQFEQRSRSGFHPEDRPPPAPDRQPSAWEQYITPGYLEAMGLTLVSGRSISERDGAGAPGVILVNEALARSIWPGRDPVGQRIRFNGSREVIGVVRSVRRTGLDVEPAPEMFIPYAQWPYNESLFVLVRTAIDPETMVEQFRSLLKSLDPGIPLGTVATMDQLIDRTLATPRFRSVVIAAFAGLALALAVLGIYGVLSYSVSLRSREFGVRQALGADARDVMRLVVRDGLRVALTGLALGLVAALGLTRFLKSFLFGLGPADPATYAVVVVVFVVAALVACYLPARRATRTDPVVSLRAD